MFLWLWKCISQYHSAFSEQYRIATTVGTLLAQHGVRDVEQFDLWVVAQGFSDKVIVGLKNWR
jgi:hypothetical protein